MIVTVNTDQAIDWNAKGVNRTAQNVANLLRLFQFEVPFDRSRGITSNIVDRVNETGMTLTISEVHRVITENEPNCKLMDVKILDSENIEVVIDVD